MCGRCSNTPIRIQAYKTDSKTERRCRRRRTMMMMVAIMMMGLVVSGGFARACVICCVQSVYASTSNERRVLAASPFRGRAKRHKRHERRLSFTYAFSMYACLACGCANATQPNLIIISRGYFFVCMLASAASVRQPQETASTHTDCLQSKPTDRRVVGQVDCSSMCAHPSSGCCADKRRLLTASSLLSSSSSYTSSRHSIAVLCVRSSAYEFCL